MDEPNFIDQDPLQSPISNLLLLVVIILLSTMLGLGGIYLLGEWKGINIEEAYASIRSANSIGIRNYIRSVLMVNHLTMFVLPALLIAVLIYKGDWAKQLDINKIPRFDLLALGSLMLIFALPFAQGLVQLTKLLPLPEWAINIEEQTGEMIENLLVVDASYELLFNILVIAVIPAIGEELVFRGWIQKKLSILFKNPSIAVWIAAIIFSAIHLQFEGFLARMVLGVVLGYLYFWTKNLWVPIFAHFVNNAMQIIVQHFYATDISNMDTESMGQKPIFIGFIFLFLVFMTGRVIQNITKREELT